MDTSTVGEILLVGEGDFSFCISMVTKLQNTQHASITATSLETDDSIQKHQDAMSNIKILRQKGITVKLDTDATKIHEDPNFSEKKFARIIFNFPHAGGKSNHKKNRKLLKDFFASSAQILDDQGQVFMTLCKGQGGTPADKPQRAWHDSWQVVSMAADADLILVKVIPFTAAEYRVYSSTGFRSQDKGFNTDLAITHVFERAKPVDIPQEVTLPISLHGNVYFCPRYIFYKLKTIRSVRHNSSHPLNKLYTSLVKALSTSAEVCDLGMLPPIQDSLSGKQLIGVGPGGQPSRTQSNCSRYSFRKCDVLDTAFGEYDQIENFVDLTGVKDDFTNIKDYESEKEHSTRLEEVGFRLICDEIDLAVVAEMLESKSTADIQVFYYPLFKNSKIYSPSSAFTYSTVFVQSLPDIDRELESTVTSPIEVQNSSFRYQVEGAVNSFIKVYGDLLGRFKMKIKISDLKDMVDKDDITLNKMYCIGTIDCLSNDHLSANVCSNNSEDVLAPRQDVGNIYLFALCRDNLHVYYLVCKLDLCDITCARSGISDRRCLWSQDYRILSQFESLDTANENELGNHKIKEPQCDQTTPCSTFTISDTTLSQHSNSGIVTQVSDLETSGNNPFKDRSSSLQNGSKDFTAPSLYPLNSIHDMSFWENESILFDESRYFDVIRDVAGDNVTSVNLIDTFTCQTSGRHSRCYRLIFESADHVMSYNSTWKLQSMIRLEVEQCLKITLR